MGNMSEEMKKIMAKWGTEDKPVQVQTEEPSLRSEIYNIVKATPGVTTRDVLVEMQKRHPAQKHNSVSSQLTTMFQQFMLRREIKHNEQSDRSVFAYYVVPPAEAVKLKLEHERKLAKARARAERARQAKAEKQKERKAQIQMPLPFDEPKTQPPVQAGVDLSSMTAVEILNRLTFVQARDLYKELKPAFGG